jgi:uncharacterized protein (DUF697 family)
MVIDEQTMDLIKLVLTLAGGSAAALITARLTRRSQAESNKINAANGLLEAYNKFTANMQNQQAATEAAHGRVVETVRTENGHLKQQVSLWRRYAQKLRQQVHQLGGTPIDPDDKLEV